LVKALKYGYTGYMIYFYQLKDGKTLFNNLKIMNTKFFDYTSYEEEKGILIHIKGLDGKVIDFAQLNLLCDL
jgi:hypothetical protein